MNNEPLPPRLPFYKNFKFWIYVCIGFLLINRIVIDFYSNYFLVVDISPKFEEVSTENGAGTSIIGQIDSIRGLIEFYKERRMAMSDDIENTEKDFPNFNPYSNAKIFHLVSIFNLLQMIPFGEMKYVRCSLGNENGLFTNQIEINKKQEDGAYKKIRFRVSNKDLNVLFIESSRSIIRELRPNSYLIYCVAKELSNEAITLGKILSKKDSNKGTSYLFYANLLYANALSENAHTASADTGFDDDFIADSIQLELAGKAIDDAEKMLNAPGVSHSPNDISNFYFYKGYYLLKKQDYEQATTCFETELKTLKKDMSVNSVLFKALSLNNLAVAYYSTYQTSGQAEKLDIAFQKIKAADALITSILSGNQTGDVKLLKSAYHVYETILETEAEIYYLRFMRNRQNKSNMQEARMCLIKAAQFGKPVTFEMCWKYPIYRDMVYEYINLCKNTSIMAKELNINPGEINKILSTRKK